MAGFHTRRGFSLSETPPLTGEVAVITGGQAGIGREITAQLLLHGIEKVYVIARTRKRYEEAQAAWAEGHGITIEDSSVRTEFLPCDLGDMLQVQKVSADLISKLDRLDILLNNAALSLTTEHELSAQNIERVFATNHVGHFILTTLLLPLLESTASRFGDTRVVTTSSSLHLSCLELDLKLLNSSEPTKSPVAIDAGWRYARSKLANILFTRELTHRLDKKGVQNVYVNSFFPGNIPTDAMDTWKELLGHTAGTVIKKTFQAVGQSEADAAATALYLASSHDVVTGDKKGKYFIPIAQEERPSMLAEDKDLSKNLWYWTDYQVSQVLGRDWDSP